MIRNRNFKLGGQIKGGDSSIELFSKKVGKSTKKRSIVLDTMFYLWYTIGVKTITLQRNLVMDHAQYQKSLKTKSVESLRYIIKDCQEAIAANPDNKKNGYYSDEICYCGMELNRRAQKI